MSTATVRGSDQTQGPLEMIAGRWATLLRTRKRDGSWVGTPVNLAVQDGLAYFGTPHITAKVRRLRNFEGVEIAPCTPRGRPTGPALAGRARRLGGPEAEAATAALQRAYPIVYRFVVPVELRLRRARNVVYEITDLEPVG